VYLGPSHPPAAEPHLGVRRRRSDAGSQGLVPGGTCGDAGGTCRPVKTTGVGSHWIKLAVTGGTSASPVRGEPEPALPCMHVDQKSIGKVARITMAATRNVIAAPSKVH
jgi:hypothetical protein